VVGIIGEVMLGGRCWGGPPPILGLGDVTEKLLGEVTLNWPGDVTLKLLGLGCEDPGWLSGLFCGPDM
jgi:hypothetical protein